jgi:hypothetical protein
VKHVGKWMLLTKKEYDAFEEEKQKIYQEILELGFELKAMSSGHEQVEQKVESLKETASHSFQIGRYEGMQISNMGFKELLRTIGRELEALPQTETTQKILGDINDFKLKMEQQTSLPQVTVEAIDSVSKMDESDLEKE